jgi:CheY-like chemotaxis protein
MMSAMQVLFVEDDDTQVQLFQDAIGDWNGAHPGQQVAIVRAADVAAARDMLSFRRIDAALFDLRLPPAKGEKGAARSGNDLAQTSLKEVGVPIGIISGNPADLDQSLKDLPLVQVFDKGDDNIYARVTAWLGEKWTMMTVLRSTRRQIQASGADIFLKRLWPRWETYTGLTGADEDELTQIVTRQYVGHVAEKLGLDGNGNASWHPYEAYIHPALLEDRAHTGDIFRLDGALAVILTPACDMATQKADIVLLAGIDEASQPEWNTKVAELTQAGLSNNVKEKRDKFFARLVNQNVDVSEHFLPPLSNGPPLMVRFKNVQTRPLEWLNAHLDLRQASIAPAFLPNLVQRFGAWISRTGQPNIEVSHFG